MDIFAQAAGDLAADPNLGADAIYARAGAAWSPRSVRVVLSVMADAMELGGLRGAVLESRRAMLPAGQIPEDPAPGDTLTIRGQTSQVAVAEMELGGASWSLTLQAPDAG